MLEEKRINTKAVSINLDKMRGKITQQIQTQEKTTHTHTHTNIFTQKTLYEICEIIKAQKARRE